MTAHASSPGAPHGAHKPHAKRPVTHKGPLEWRLLLTWLTEDKVISLKDA